MKAEKLHLGMIVYHRDVYQCREPLKVVGIKEDEVELEGDYSGGTHNVVQRSWLPIKGVRRTRNYDYLLECKRTMHLIRDGEYPDKDKEVDRLLKMVFVLTNHIKYEDEFKEDWDSITRSSVGDNTNNIL